MSHPRDSKVIVTSNISKVDVLEGLWRCSSPALFFQTIPNGDDVRKKQEAAAWKNKKDVENTLRSNPWIDYFGGRCIKTNISNYPEVDLASYKKNCNIEMSFQEIYEKCINKP